MTTSAHSYYLVLGLLGWHKSNHRAWVLFTLLRVVHVLEPQNGQTTLEVEEDIIIEGRLATANIRVSQACPNDSSWWPGNCVSTGVRMFDKTGTLPLLFKEF